MSKHGSSSESSFLDFLLALLLRSLSRFSSLFARFSSRAFCLSTIFMRLCMRTTMSSLAMPSADAVPLSTGVLGCDGLSESFCDTSAKAPDHTTTCNSRRPPKAPSSLHEGAGRWIAPCSSCESLSSTFSAAFLGSSFWLASGLSDAWLWFWLCAIMMMRAQRTKAAKTKALSECELSKDARCDLVPSLCEPNMHGTQ